MFIWTEFTEPKIWLAGRVCVFVKVFQVPNQYYFRYVRGTWSEFVFIIFVFLYMYICRYISILCILNFVINNSEYVRSK